MNYTYKPVMRGTRWVIECTDEKGETDIMTCGINPTREEVLARIRMLRVDDDNINVKRGQPRVLQG
jgi:hypothetical protein